MRQRESDKFEPEVRLAPIPLPKESMEEVLAWEKPSSDYDGPEYFVRAHGNIPESDFAVALAEAHRCSISNHGAPVGVYQRIPIGRSTWVFYKCVTVVHAKSELEFLEEKGSDE